MKPETRREVEIARAAMVRGMMNGGRTMVYANNYATRAYPMPTITRPRVYLASYGGEYRVVGGVIEYRYYPDDSFRPCPESTQEYSRAIADLLANPTETVEAPE